MEQLNLNLIPGKTLPVCHASQYDVGRTFRFNLFEGSSAYTLAGTETAEVHIRKPDDTVVTASLTVAAQSYLDVITTQQMTACAGANLGEIQIKSGSNIIGTINFIMEVERDPMTGGVDSESEIQDLQAQVNAATATAVSSLFAELYSNNEAAFDNLKNGRVANDDIIFTSSDVNEGQTIYYHIIANTNYAGYIGLYNSSNVRLAYYGKASSSASENEYIGSFQIPAGFSYAKVVATRGTTASYINLAWLSKDKEVPAQIQKIESGLYYAGMESFAATSSNKMSNHGAILLKANKIYKILGTVPTGANRLRFFLWKISTGEVDTSYYVDLVPSNGATIIKPTADSYLVTYNIDSLATLSADVYVFEYGDEQLNITIKEYYVAKNVNYNDKHHYTSLTQCLLDLKNDETEKIIYIEGGTYDLVTEYSNAGVPVPDSSVPDSDYWNYNVWVPKNTHIIGRGIVKLVWSPTTSQTTAKQSNIVSPLNVANTCTVENLEIYCKNGRYCLHNDGLANVKFIGARQIFKNCKFYKQANDEGYGKAMTTGFGISARMQHIYEDCEFYNEITTAAAFYGHSRKLVGAWTIDENNSGNILLKNCIIKTPYSYAVRLDNDAVSGLHIKTKFESCYLSGNIRVNESSGYANGFDIIVLNCNNPAITGTTGDYTPQVYPS